MKIMDSLFETSREEHSEYVDGGFDDSCTTTPTLNSFGKSLEENLRCERQDNLHKENNSQAEQILKVPDTKSPVHQSEDEPIMKHSKNEVKGSKNNTIQAPHVQNSPDMKPKLGAVLDDDHKGVLSEIDHNKTYKMTVMEDYSNQLGKRTKKGEGKADKDKRFKRGAIEKCTSCDAMQHRCNDLQKQCSDHQRQLNESQEKVKFLENIACTSCEERKQQEITTLNEKIKMLIERNEKSASEINMLNADKEKSHREKEEVIATMSAEVERREKNIKSLGKKNADLQKINEDMASRIDELEDQIEGRDAEQNELKAELNEVSTRANNLFIHNGELQHIANDLEALQTMEESHRRERVEERNAFVKTIDDLNEEKNSLKETITELEQKHERLLTQLDTALATIEAEAAERETTRTHTNILRISNELLQRQVNQLVTSLQALGGQQQDDQTSRGEIGRIVQGLLLFQQQPQPDNSTGHLQFSSRHKLVAGH